MRRATNFPIPYGDFKKHINVILKRKWQSQWDEAIDNKLHEIHPKLSLWPGGSRIIRREEIVLTRIRIGHTHLTQCFLLKGYVSNMSVKYLHHLFNCISSVQILCELLLSSRVIFINIRGADDTF